MAKFRIEYGLGGGYNINEVEIVECDCLEYAQQWAYECAVGIFESYGIFDYEGYEEEGLTDEEVSEAYSQEIDSWCHYRAEEIIE